MVLHVLVPKSTDGNSGSCSVGPKQNEVDEVFSLILKSFSLLVVVPG